MSCLFCKIINKEIPNHTIYEDEKYLAFLDIFPMSEGHTLVIPKTHFSHVWDVENIGEYFEVCQKIARHFQSVSGEKIISSFIHGEEIPHAHVHLFAKDGNRFTKALGTLVDGKLEDVDAERIVDKFKFKF